MYSVFMEVKEGLFADSIDGEWKINKVVVKALKMAVVELRLDNMAILN